MAIFNFAGSRPKTLGVKDGRLAPCPAAKRNCVCSQQSQDEPADGRHHVQPWTYAGEAGDAKARVIALLRQEAGCSIVTDTPHYLHAEFQSQGLGFVDDVEFLIAAQEKLIHIRSASRLGLSDFGVNRARVQRLREAFLAAT